MANITAEQVKELRDATNISMMECKKALVEANGDFEGALKVLRNRGLAVASKRADKEANEGIVKVFEDASGVFMLAIGCETDFVANSADFQNMSERLISGYVKEGESFLKKPETESLINETVAKCGEKIVVNNHSSYLSGSDKICASYVHGNKKIGVIVMLESDASKKDAAKVLAKDLAMQIAAMNPIAISQNEVSKEMRDEQVALYTKQLKEEGKSGEMLEKIVSGKVNKYFSDYCLEDMLFIKDGKTKIKDLLLQVKKESAAGKMQILGYKRFQIGR